VHDASVRTREECLGDWTDDTRMSLYLGEAMLAHGAGPLRAEAFGTTVGEAFVRRLHDPLSLKAAVGARRRPFRTRGSAHAER
jgi:hypothetical protein